MFYGSSREGCSSKADFPSASTLKRNPGFEVTVLLIS